MEAFKYLHLHELDEPQKWKAKNWLQLYDKYRTQQTCTNTRARRAQRKRKLLNVWHAYESIRILWSNRFDTLHHRATRTSHITNWFECKTIRFIRTCECVCVCASKSETKIERRNKMPVILIVKHFNRISIVFNLLHLGSVLCVRLWQCFPSHLLVQANYIQPSAVLWYPVQWHVLLSKIWHFKNIYISKNKSLRFDVHADASHRNI